MTQIFSRHHLYLCLFLLLPIIYFLSLPITVSDLSVWIAHGKYFVDHGEILRHDIFSVLPTVELIYSAGSSILYGYIYSWSGLDGVILFHRFVAFAIVFIWYFASLKKLSSSTSSPWTLKNLCFVLLAWAGSAVICIDRQALLAMLPFLVSYLILSQEKELSLKEIMYLNLVNVLWVNIHGSWLILLAMYIWREGMRVILRKQVFKVHTIFGLVSILITSLLNPFGVKVFPYTLETSQISRAREISEWAGLFSGYHIGQAIIFIFLILIAGFLFWRFDKQRKINFIASPFFLFLIVGFLGIRMTVYSFFIFLPWAFQFGLLNSSQEKVSTSRIGSAINAVLMLSVMTFTILLFPQNKEKIAGILPKDKKAVYDEDTLFDMARILSATEDNGPIFNHWDYGSFLILSQPHKIFVDTRNIIYSNQQILEYLHVLEAKEGWQQILDRYKIKYLLLKKITNSPLTEVVRRNPEWKILNENSEAVLFSKN